MDAASDAQTTAAALAPFWNALPDSHPAGARDIGAYRFYFADAEGKIVVGAYREDLEWFHGLLWLRYGPQIVTSFRGTASRRWFGFARERIENEAETGYIFAQNDINAQNEPYMGNVPTN